MKYFKNIFRRLWTIWFYAGFIAIFLLFYPLFYILLSKKKWHHAANRLRVVWAKLLFSFIGIRAEPKFEVPLDEKGSYIYCPNHTSYIDIPVFTATCKGYFHYMAKAELAKIPLFSIFFKTIDIPVNRASKIGSYKAFKKASENLKNGESIVIFPEGTISHAVPKLLKFKNGPFLLAVNEGVPVVPVTMLDNWKILPDDSRHAGRPGRARVIFHKPIETKGMTEADVPMLKEQVFKIIEKELEKEWGKKE